MIDKIFKLILPKTYAHLAKWAQNTKGRIENFKSIEALKNEAWKAQKEERNTTVERLLTEVALRKLKDEFEQSASSIRKRLYLTTPDGVYENQEHTISQKVLGLIWGLEGRDTYISGHTTRISNASTILNSDISKEIFRTANQIGLNANFSYHSIENHNVDGNNCVREKYSINKTSHIYLKFTRNWK